MLISGSGLQRGEHDIEHEIMFSKHEGYVFHDSRGFEGGSADELKTVQDFVRRRSQEWRLKDRLHAIWFIPLMSSTTSSQMFAFQVLRSDGLCSAIPRVKTFRRYLPR